MIQLKRVTLDCSRSKEVIFLSQKIKSYTSNGVHITPSVPAVNQLVSITYNGILLQNGAVEVYAHVGFGNNWKSATDHKMNRTTQGFETSFPIDSYTDRLNVCFKDSANNWDNNSGFNYTFPVKKHSVEYSLDYEAEVCKK